MLLFVVRYYHVMVVVVCVVLFVVCVVRCVTWFV